MALVRLLQVPQENMPAAGAVTVPATEAFADRPLSPVKGHLLFRILRSASYPRCIAGTGRTSSFAGA